MESSGVDWTLERLLKFNECAIAGAPLGQVFTPILKQITYFSNQQTQLIQW